MNYDSYLENRVYGASPAELVCLLYRKAIEKSKVARTALAQGDIPGRAAALTRVVEIVSELANSLAEPQGSDQTTRDMISNLRRLYEYLIYLATQANAQQSAKPLDEIEKILGTLLEAWEPLAQGAPAAAPAALEPPQQTMATPRLALSFHG